MLGRDGASRSRAFRDAVERGVRLDVGHSATDFRFRDARRLIDAGYQPDTISTDLNIFNIDHPVVSLPETMSKIWALGCRPRRRDRDGDDQRRPAPSTAKTSSARSTWAAPPRSR